MDKYKKAKQIVKEFEKIQHEKEEQELLEHLKEQVGKTFVYRDNNYGCGDSRKWDVFSIVLEVIDSHHVIIEDWELIEPNIFKIKRYNHYVYHKNSWIHREPCNKDEFETNKQKVMELLTK